MRAVCVESCYVPGLEGVPDRLYVAPGIYPAFSEPWVGSKGPEDIVWVVILHRQAWRFTPEQFNQHFMLLDED